MDIITSIDNKKLQHLKKLDDKKYRGEFNEYVAEGQRWLSDAFLCSTGKKTCKSVFLSQAFYENNVQIVEVASKIVEEDNLHIVSDVIFNKVASAQTSQGILGVFSTNILGGVVSSGQTLYLDRVRDPGNMGSIIRCCVAAGFDNIILDNCVDIYNPKTVRSTMSALLKVNFFNAENCPLSALKQQGFTIFGADMGGENIFTYDNICDKVCLVMGNEASGVSDELESQFDKTVSIPMGDIESLNVAVSASILMYQINKNRFI